MSWRRVALLVAAVVALSGPAAASAATPAPSPLHWTSCAHSFQCATLAVPLDDTVPTSPTINLALARLPAADSSQRIGSLLVNPGGPGASGVQYLEQDAKMLPSTIRDRFDIVAWDPRGSGASDPVTCSPNLDSLYNLEFAPKDDAARQALVSGIETFVASCKARSGPELPYVSSERTARDMDRIRAALGDPKLTYLGFSYGTYLGSLYAAQFPTHIRAMVLDGAVDPALSAAAQQVQQAVGFEHDLDLFLQSCATDPSCAFYRNGNAAGSYDALRARVDATPIPANGAGRGRTLNGTEFDIGVTQYLYAGRAAWSELASALDSADKGDGSQLVENSDQYTMRNSDGTYSQEQAAFLGIGCLDGPDVGGVAGLRAIEDQAAQAAPRLGRSVVNNSLACAVWPVPTQTAAVPHPVGAPPIVVIGNSDDPATPLAWAEGLTRELGSAVLVTVKSAQHTAYGSGNACVDRAVNRYLLSRVPPKPGTRC
jgi:pimeloyl-ACP methyl ester carboxylesterase